MFTLKYKNDKDGKNKLLTYLMPLVSFCTHRKYQKTRGFQMFSEGIESDL